MVQQLTLKGVPLNQVDMYGVSTLHHAVRSTCARTVLACLPRDSPIDEVTDVAAATLDRQTPLHTACRLGASNAVHAIVSYCNWMVREQMMTPARRCEYLNAQTRDGKTALAIAVMRGWRDIASFLSASGADVDLADRTMVETPLHWAAKLNEHCCAKVLLANGADVDRRNAGGRRPYQELDVLTTFRGGPRHDVREASIAKFGFERYMQMLACPLSERRILDGEPHSNCAVWGRGCLDALKPRRLGVSPRPASRPRTRGRSARV